MGPFCSCHISGDAIFSCICLLKDLYCTVGTACGDIIARRVVSYCMHCFGHLRPVHLLQHTWHRQTRQLKSVPCKNNVLVAQRHSDGLQLTRHAMNRRDLNTQRTIYYRKRGSIIISSTVPPDAMYSPAASIERDVTESW